MQQQELEIARADLAGGAEAIAATAAVTPVAAEKSAAMAMSAAPAAAPADTATPASIFLFFFMKSHVLVFPLFLRLCHLTYRKI
jgi:hypothetical protein